MTTALPTPHENPIQPNPSGEPNSSNQQDHQPLRLALALRERTGPLHAQAEQSGFIRAILHGRASRHGYALYLRNLLPAYQEMEQGLDRHRHRPGLYGIADPRLFRARTIIGDLVALRGPDWAQELHLLPAGTRYASQVAAAADGDGAGLIGHAYTRYLGDLSGAQLLKRSLMRSLGLQPDMLGFYDFPAIPDLPAFKTAFRAALDKAARIISDTDLVVSEAMRAFHHNIEISEAVHAASIP